MVFGNKENTLLSTLIAIGIASSAIAADNKGRELSLCPSRVHATRSNTSSAAFAHDLAVIAQGAREQRDQNTRYCIKQTPTHINRLSEKENKKLSYTVVPLDLSSQEKKIVDLQCPQKNKAHGSLSFQKSIEIAQQDKIQQAENQAKNLRKSALLLRGAQEQAIYTQQCIDVLEQRRAVIDDACLFEIEEEIQLSRKEVLAKKEQIRKEKQERKKIAERARRKSAEKARKALELALAHHSYSAGTVESVINQHSPYRSPKISRLLLSSARPAVTRGAHKKSPTRLRTRTLAVAANQDKSGKTWDYRAQRNLLSEFKDVSDNS